MKRLPPETLEQLDFIAAGEVRFLPGQDTYAISDRGILFSRYYGQWQRIRGSMCHEGYLRAKFLPGTYPIRIAFIHRLVLEAFVGPCPEEMQACHGNGIRHDNRLENLRWDTRVGNAGDRILHGTAGIGERNPSARMTEEAVRQLQDMFDREGTSYAELGRRFGICDMQARKIALRKAWCHIDKHPATADAKGVK